ncbi:Xaa-Pro dipeptidase [Diplonema papillatum]|nr:Xaa-Pro dipeptidase [Diplonema papillatum]
MLHLAAFVVLAGLLELAAGSVEADVRRPKYGADMMKDELDLAFEMGAVDRRLYRSALARIGMHDVSAFERPKPVFVGDQQLPEYVDPVLYGEVERLRSEYAKVLRLPSKSSAKAFARFNEPNTVCLMVGADLEMRTGSDTEILFRQESNFIYATGWDHPGARALIGMDPSPSAVLPLGAAWLFVPQRDPVWVGLEDSLENYMKKYDVYNVSWISDYFPVLDEVIKPDNVVQWDSSSELLSAFNEARVHKLDDEVELIRAATQIAVEEHKKVMQHITCGMWESDAESLFRYVGHNYGARFQSYLPIVGSGPNSAALHYKDNDAVIPEGSLVLIDAAAEMGATRNGGGYCSDITRTWPCSGRFTLPQREVYAAVWEAQNVCINNAVVGATLAELGERSAKALLAGLSLIGIVRGNIQSMYDAGIHSLFMPHSIGHSVGLNVHDPSSSASPFEPNTVITCEPGCYFYPSLLDAAYADPVQAQYLVRARIEGPFITMGGIRIEDVVRVTPDGPELLSAGLPRSAAEIESFMSGVRGAAGQ